MTGQVRDRVRSARMPAKEAEALRRRQVRRAKLAAWLATYVVVVLS